MLKIRALGQRVSVSDVLSSGSPGKEPQWKLMGPETNLSRSVLCTV